jgi:hypothetical protein
MLPPERSNIVLSCLADPGDLSGLVDRVQISGPCVLFLTDNPRMERLGLRELLFCQYS